MKVREVIDQLKVGDDVWVKGKVKAVEEEPLPLVCNISENGIWLYEDDEISLTEPQVEKGELPESVAKWLEASKRDKRILGRAMNTLSEIMPDDVKGWLHFKNHKNHEMFARAWLYGYTIQEDRWVVSFQKHGTTFFFSHWDSISSFVPVGCSTITNDCIARFTDKEKAHALANLIGGSVVPLEFWHE